MLGTRFLATPEANTHPTYRERLLVADVDDTALTTLFGQDWPDTPHRVIRTGLVDEWLDRVGSEDARRPDRPLIGATRIAGQEIPLPRFASLPPSAEAGDHAVVERNAAGPLELRRRGAGTPTKASETIETLLELRRNRGETFSAYGGRSRECSGGWTWEAC